MTLLKLIDRLREYLVYNYTKLKGELPVKNDIGGIKELILWVLKTQGFNYKSIDGYFIGLDLIKVKINNTIVTIHATPPTTDWYITDVCNLGGR